MSFNLEEIKNLPPESVEDIKIGSKRLTICTYKDELPNGEILVIVQCKNTRFLGYGNMFAEGFVVSESSEKRKAEEILMWEYV
ncbi:hypothetical protein SAMN05660479_01004 [Microbulbifer thermotolerans]|nr:hypothetical protein SAMN05660479_01004 [Microbulbifer thermotolerans]